MATAEFFDTHAHLDFPEFQADLEGVVERAQAAGITRILSVGTSMASSRRVLALADRFPGVYAVVGVHPNHVLEEPDDIAGELAELVRHPKVVAVGETGMDFYRLDGMTEGEVAALKDKQRRLFGQQLTVAAEAGLNCVIHQRAAFAETLEVMEPFEGRLKGVFHCFTGTPAEATEVLRRGSLVSFTGITTFKNAQNVRDALAVVPAGKLMLETDCPFLAPVPYRGKRCEPAYVRELAEYLALERKCTLETLSAETCATAREFFRGLN
jgi:TatD DNase family protein